VCVYVIVFSVQVFVEKIKNFALKFSMQNDVRDEHDYFMIYASGTMVVAE